MSAPQEVNSRIKSEDPFLVAAGHVLRTLDVRTVSIPELHELQEQSVGPAMALVPCFARLRTIRVHYSQLELAKYGEEWKTLEKLDGTKGDLGKLSKLETGRRGLRDGFSPEALSHELVDCLWSLVIVADSAGIDPETACAEADRRGALDGTPRQLINKLGLAVHIIDEILDPPPEPTFALEGIDRGALLVSCFAEGFRTVTALAQGYDIHLPQSVVQNMDLLEQRIPTEYPAA
jgi:hypothetical protein